MLFENKRQRVRVLPLVIRDVAMVAVVLVIFALFHHVLPRKGEAITTIVALNQLSAATAGAAEQAGGGMEHTATAQTLEATPLPAPSPSPVVYAPGDFSAAFPQEDTGANALHSYQSDNLRIAVNMVQENDITYYIADVWVRDIRTFQTAFAQGEYGVGVHAEPKKIADENNAIFAITGDYCGARNSGVVIRNGNLYRDSVSSDVCVLYIDGTMKTYAQEEFDVMEAVNGDAWQAWGFGPRLLNENGEAIDTFDSSIKGKNPRSAMGYFEPGHYCFITVDGRQNGYSVGMTLAELSQVFADLGCKAAFNLDGGATAQMIFQGELVNRPYNGERQSSDIICFSEERAA